MTRPPKKVTIVSAQALLVTNVVLGTRKVTIVALA